MASELGSLVLLGMTVSTETPLNTAINSAAKDQLLAQWGGQLPTWEAYKTAKRRGEVRLNRSVAFEVIRWRGMPKRYVALHAVETVAALLAIPAAVGVYLLGIDSAWSIAVAAPCALVLWNKSKQAAYAGVMVGAERDEQLYRALVQRGAFSFPPPWQNERWLRSTEARVRDDAKAKGIKATKDEIGKMLSVAEDTWAVVGAYSQVLEQLENERAERRFDFYPVSRLPFPKDRIRRALNELLAKTTDREFAKSLETGLTYLGFAMEDTEYQGYKQRRGAFAPKA